MAQLKIKNVILIDGGSTHNFIQDRVVKFLGCRSQNHVNLLSWLAMAINSNAIARAPMYQWFWVTINFIDFYILPLTVPMLY